MPFNEATVALGGRDVVRTAWQALRTGHLPSSDCHGVNLFPGHSVTAVASSSCQTSKLLLRLHDGLEVESVIIPMAGANSDIAYKHTTICVSSQVGCAQACRFCATGAMGRRRGLSTGEILAQIFEGALLAREQGLPPISNVTFMGQGEPLDNADAVEGALRALTDQRLFGLAPRRITVSTVGPSPEAIRRMATWPAHIAWSVHAADDELRKQLVPSAKHSAAALRDAFRDVLTARHEPGSVQSNMLSGRQSRSIMIEATLIDGVNDAPSHAEQLVQLLMPLVAEDIAVRVNLIPYNRNDGLRGEWAASFRPSPAEHVKAFRARLLDAGMFCSTRAQRGAEDAAACGMLATASRRKGRSAGARSVARTAASMPTRSSPKTTWLLDIDGTLLFTDHLYRLVFVELLTPLGYDVTDDFYAASVHGRVDSDVFGNLMPAGTSEEELRAMSQKKDACFVKLYNEHTNKEGGPPMVPGLAEALEAAKRAGVRAIAVTNAQRGAGEATIESLRAQVPAATIIEGLVIGAECTQAKPAPDPYIEGMRQLGVGPEECLVFADSTSGVRSGVAAGVTCVGLRSCLDDAQLLASGCALTIADWTELTPDVLTALDRVHLESGS